MQRYGSSIGKGAGWPTRVADSAGKSQVLFVKVRNSPFVIVFSLLCGLREKLPLEKISTYSCTSLNVGLDADCQLPHAVETPELAALFQICNIDAYSPTIYKDTKRLFKNLLQQVSIFF